MCREVRLAWILMPRAITEVMFAIRMRAPDAPRWHGSCRFSPSFPHPILVSFPPPLSARHCLNCFLHRSQCFGPSFLVSDLLLLNAPMQV